MNLDVKLAGPQDAEAWVQLQGGGSVDAYHAARPEEANARYLLWLGDTPIACYRLGRYGRVAEVGDFRVAAAFHDSHVVAAVQAIVAQARPFAGLVRAHFPLAYSSLFHYAYFDPQHYMRMRRSLTDYAPPPISLPATITLRPPTSADAGAVAELMQRNYQHTIEWATVYDLAQPQREVHNLMGAGVMAAGCSYLAEDAAGQLVGEVFTVNEGDDDLPKLAWVADISVAPSWRGRGLGKAMLTATLNAAQAAGYLNIGLGVRVGNWTAQRLYRAFGFKEYGPLEYFGALLLD